LLSNPKDWEEEGKRRMRLGNFQNNKTIMKFVLFLIVTLIIIFPFIIDQPYIMHIMIMVFIYATLAGAWNILSGYTGQISLGNAMFFGLGAYTSSILWINFNINPWIGMIIGGLFAATFGIFLGMPIFRLRRQYLTIATIAASQIVMTIFLNWKYVNGAAGIELKLMPDSLKNMTFLYEKNGFYFISLAILIFFTFVVFVITKTKLGYYFRTIKEEEDAAKSIGINTAKYKLVAISITAFFSAIVGTVYAQYFLYIDPNMILSLRVSIIIVLIAAFGGTATIFGPILGAFIIIPISEIARIVFGGAGRGVDLLFFGILILLVALYRPAGFISLFYGKEKLAIRKTFPGKGGKIGGENENIES
jgi:branched-chain amino acid transport system permease protein